MPYSITTLLVILVYRTILAVAAVSFVYLGYRLVRSGEAETASDLELGWGDGRLKMSRATPGVFLMIVGCVILALSIVYGPMIKGESYGIHPERVEGDSGLYIPADSGAYWPVD
jgi:hypothetical protein